MTGRLDEELAALVDADPGAAPSPMPEPGEMGIDEYPVNSAEPSQTEPQRPEELAIVTAREFAAVTEPGANPLLGESGEAVIPEGGDVMLYGDGGASKTTLSIDLACHLAAGDPWLGIPVSKPTRVLLVEAEGPRPLFRRKIKEKLASWRGSNLGDRLTVLERPWAEFRFDDEQAHTRARRFAELKVDVLVVGPLTRVGMDELGTLQQVRDFMGQVARFRALADRRLTVFLVHHENKGGGVSGAWEGAGDTLLHAQVHGQGKTTLTFQKARWASGWHKRVLELSWAEGESFEVGEDERDYADEIEELLRETDKWLTVEELRRPREKGGIGANRDDLRDALEGNPGRFVALTGDDAKAVGRSPRATVWQLAQALERVERVARSQGDTRTHSLTRSTLKGRARDERVSPEQAELAQAPERVRAGCASHPEPVAGCRYCRQGA